MNCICERMINNKYLSGSSDKEEETEEDDDDDDELDEEELIKQMLAKEQQKLSQENNHDDDDDDNDNEEVEASSAPSDSENFSVETTSTSNVMSSTATVTASTAAKVSSSTTSKTVSSTESTYPVSSTGRCPYCGASDVKYIIVVSENTKDTELPQSLQQLLKSNHAFKMAKGEVQRARATSRGRVSMITKIISKLHWDHCMAQYLFCLGHDPS